MSWSAWNASAATFRRSARSRSGGGFFFGIDSAEPVYPTAAVLRWIRMADRLILDDADELENKDGHDTEQQERGGPGDPLEFLIF